MGMAQLTVVGSSDAFHAGGRCHSCYLLEGEGFGPLMIDFGATALHALRKLGRDPSEIKGIAFTHLHGDHCGGWPFLIIDGMFNDVRSQVLDVVGPAGTTDTLQRSMAVAYSSLADKEKPYEVAIREMAPGDEQSIAGVTVRGFAANHRDPPYHPLCLRVTLPSGEIVAFSGDTAMCDGLFDAADGVDLLVAECSAIAPPCGRHCTWVEWKDKLGELSAKRVLLTHLGREVRARVDELLAEAPKGVDVAFADDGMIVSF
jgi:ribonuclease BN (tRNA processing enzyme)